MIKIPIKYDQQFVKRPNQELEYTHEQIEGGVSLEEALPKIKEPPMYRVVLLNDDFTPMDFVVAILMEFFAMTNERALQVMLEIHAHGKGVCGVFTREIAETKVAQVNAHARGNEYPLLCTMEVT